MLDALKIGNRIDNPATLKNVQNGTNGLAALASLVIVGLQVCNVSLPITDEQIVLAAGGLATILGVVNSVVTTITSRKVGLRTRD